MRRNPLLKFASLIWLATTFASGGWAQSPSDESSAIIRVETREVPVDVTVTGRRSGPQGELNARDFSVWEDGKPQKINSVIPVVSDPRAVFKHFVFYFDFNTMPLQDQVASEKSAAAFVAEHASSDRYMAVMSMSPSGPRVLQDFTTATAALRLAILNAQVATGRTGSNEKIGDSLSTVCDSIASAPGRKALLLFTGGYSEGSTFPSFKAPLAVCNRANVAIYVITGNSRSAGLASYQQQGTCRGCDGPVVTVAQETPQDGAAAFAQHLADGTGGLSFLLGSNLAEQLGSVAREQDEYYRVFYSPPPSQPGTCHLLRVAVAARGLGTRARNEYCTERLEDLTDERSTRAFGAGVPTLDAAIRLPYFYVRPDLASVQLSMDFAPSGVKFVKDKSGVHGQIGFYGAATRADGSIAARFSDTRTIDLKSQESPEAFTKAAYHYEHTFSITPGTYRFHIAVDESSAAYAKVEMPLEVDPWNPSRLGMGSIVFSALAIPAPTSAAPNLEDHHLLVAGGKQFTTAATSHFLRSDQIYFYTEVYTGDSSGVLPATDPSTLKMQYRIIDARSGQVKVDTGMNGVGSYVRQGVPVVPFATRISSADLATGVYRLEVTASIQGLPEPVSRTAEFELR